MRTDLNAVELVARNRELCERCSALRIVNRVVREKSAALAFDAAEMRELLVQERQDALSRKQCFAERHSLDA